MKKKSNIKPVTVTDPDGKVTEYESGLQAATALKCPQSYISSMCLGRKDNWKGYRAVYTKQEETP